jgi:hypothetical protein
MTLTHRCAWLGCSLVVAAATFNMVLCFLNTHALAIKDSHVIASEVIIITFAMVLSYRFILDTRILIAFLLFSAYFCAMWLMFLALLLGESGRDDSLIGRLVISGATLAKLDIAEWFGDFGTKFLEANAGYAFVVNSIGLVGGVALWMFFSASMPRTPEAIRFKRLIAIYACLSLCIGAAFFSIKTAALLWFLYSAVHSRRAEEQEQRIFGRPESRPDWKLIPLPGLAGAPHEVVSNTLPGNPCERLSLLFPPRRCYREIAVVFTPGRNCLLVSRRN